MQTLEDPEDLLLILGRNANPVIGNADNPLVVARPRRNVHLGRRNAAILERIADEVLEHLREMRWMHWQYGKIVAGHAGVAARNLSAEIGGNLVKDATRVGNA